MNMMDRFWYCDATFDAVETARRHAATSPETIPGHFVSYYGVAIDTKFFPAVLPPGCIETDSLPANWHADLAEFAASFRAVDLASETFVMAELGCGWGCWMLTTGIAARRVGLDVHLIGVEGDLMHVGYAREAIVTNGFSAEQVTLHHGIAAAMDGVALFPNQAGNSWGLAPVFGASEAEMGAAREGGYEVLPMIGLADLAPGRVLDLLHMDIQGGEVDLVASAIDYLNGNVAYMVIGTHSREIEGQLFALLLNHGWRLEIDRPAIYHMNHPRPIISIDGVHGWRNMRLRPEA